MAAFAAALLWPSGASAGRVHGLWAGQASIEVPKSVRLKKVRADRYVLRMAGTEIEVTVDRGSIPSKYHGASTEKIARVARDRLRRQGHRIEAFAVAGKGANIIFSGVKRQTVKTPRGEMKIDVPWRGHLRWMRQTNHRTYQSLVVVSQAERGKRPADQLQRAAKSLRIPPMRRTARERMKTARGSVPMLTEKMGSWMPGWGLR